MVNFNKLRAFAVTLLAGATIASLLAGCSVNPATGKTDILPMSKSREIEIGRELHEEIVKSTPLYTDKAVQNYVNEVGQRVAKKSHRSGLDYTFTLIDSPDINAYALPGGYIYLNRGLLTYLNSEAQLAAVLAHEVGHVTARHASRQQSSGVGSNILAGVAGVLTGSQAVADLVNLGGAALTRGYGRKHELEADSLGAEYLYKAGYDPQAMIGVIGVLKEQEQFSKYKAGQEGTKPKTYHGVFATHPRNDTRLREIVDKAGALPEGSTVTNEDVFRRKTTGLEFGGGTKAGVVRNNRFYHKTLGFTLAFPSTWKVKNSPSSVMAFPKSQEAYMQLRLQTNIKDIKMEDLLRERFNIEDLSKQKSFKIHGLDALTAIMPATDKKGPVRLAVIYKDNTAFVISGVNRKPNAAINYDPFFMASINSFRPLKSEDIKQAAVRKIRYARAGKHTTYAGLARKSKIPKYAEAQLRLLNGHYPTGEPTPGQWLKIVE